VLRSILGSAAAIAVLVGAAAAGAKTLSVSGVVLDDARVNPASAAVTATVELGGDAPEATYVMASMPDGKRLMRGADGYWRNWNGRTESLIDNGFKRNGNQLTFKILKEDLSDRFFPIRITVAYKASGRLKFGVFQVVPE